MELLVPLYFSATSSKVAEDPLVEHLYFAYHVILKRIDVDLYEHLNSLDIKPDYFLLRWMRILFCREFPMDQLFLVWDFLFGFGGRREKSVSDTTIVPDDLQNRFKLCLSSFSTAIITEPRFRADLMARNASDEILESLKDFPNYTSDDIVTLVLHSRKIARDYQNIEKRLIKMDSPPTGHLYVRLTGGKESSPTFFGLGVNTSKEEEAPYFKL